MKVFYVLFFLRNILFYTHTQRTQHNQNQKKTHKISNFNFQSKFQKMTHETKEMYTQNKKKCTKTKQNHRQKNQTEKKKKLIQF